MQNTFEHYKTEIRRLFFSEHLTISAIQEIMRKKYGFSESISAYKTKLAEWNMFIPLSSSTRIGKHQHLFGNRSRPERLCKIPRVIPRSVPLTPPLSPPALRHQNGNARIKQERAAPCSISLIVHSGEKKSRDSFYQDEYIVILAELRGRLGAALGRESG
ncbi:predicted protein [Sclerotinia sclerotiorum 1980 UF-70]|uniref:Clr5 domain-containing protein n=2 Tax=Sclerotinia sclerotiorum (strain ATCC 18683 / 1980 / Ss-1) TaxID=665079 RepID=A7EB52_SCLS1|nr:predicted protein [Sclerotinia sclerotiorum 1980 UF-70]APA08761.1 hypothetical protein sscle_04g035310 [Sclerotinia sclerotiorum 1980 UF-70]EDN99680.1 predicted protein [Sclerotinia sclerotiorum 1980 UF-70]